MKTKTFHGPHYRVQLGVLDRREVPLFLVYVLPAHYHESTAFRCKAGDQVYYGDDLAAAWGMVAEYAPHASRPVSWFKKYAAAAKGGVA